MRQTRSKTKTPVKEQKDAKSQAEVSPTLNTPKKSPTIHNSANQNKRLVKAELKQVQASQKIAEISKAIANQEEKRGEVTPKNKRPLGEEQSTTRNHFSRQRDLELRYSSKLMSKRRTTRDPNANTPNKRNRGDIMSENNDVSPYVNGQELQLTIRREAADSLNNSPKRCFEDQQITNFAA